VNLLLCEAEIVTTPPNGVKPLRKRRVNKPSSTEDRLLLIMTSAIIRKRRIFWLQGGIAVSFERANKDCSFDP
jgi:hypothetical protein